MARNTMRVALLLLVAFGICHPALAQEGSRALETWAIRVNALMRPKIYHPEPLPPREKVETQVELALRPDGEVQSFRILKPSGVESWDKAVLEAVSKTERLPLSSGGTVPARLIMHFRPR
jgi:colicin import membrane protein